MENFREMEKEFKKKQFSKKSLQHSHKHRRGARSGLSDGSSSEGGSSDDDESDDEGGSQNPSYGDENSDEERKTSEAPKKEDIQEDSVAQRQKNAEYLQAAKEFLKAQVSKIDGELEVAKNKKVKGASIKKQKERIASLNSLQSQVKKQRERLDELIISMEYVESFHIKDLVKIIDAFMANTEDQNALNALDTDLPRVLEVIEQFKKVKQ